MWKHLFIIAPFFLCLYASADDFVVENIDVDFTAESAVLAQEQAFDQGESNAFWKLMQKMVLPSDIEKIPPITKEDIKGFIKSYIVQEEKRSDIRYIAKLKYIFNAKAISDFLLKHNISFSESLVHPIIVISILETPQENELICSIWDKVRDKIDLKNFTLPFIIHPNKSCEKTFEIKNQAVVTLLTELKQQYKTNNISLLHIKIEPTSNLIEDKALMASTKIYPCLHDQPDYVIQLGTIEFSEKEASNNLVGLINQSLREIEKERLAQNQEDQIIQKETIELIIPTQNLDRWHQNVQKIQSIPGILIQKIKSISNNTAHVIIQISDINYVTQQLLQKGFQVEPYHKYLILGTLDDSAKPA